MVAQSWSLLCKVFYDFSASIHFTCCIFRKVAFETLPFHNHTHSSAAHAHTMSKGSLFLCWQEPSLAQQSPVDGRRGRDLKRSAQADCLQLAAWWANHTTGEGSAMFILCCYTGCLSGGKMTSWVFFTFTREIAQYSCRPKHSAGCCNMLYDSTSVTFCFLNLTNMWLSAALTCLLCLCSNQSRSNIFSAMKNWGSSLCSVFIKCRCNKKVC